MHQQPLAILGGTVVTASEAVPASVLVRDGVVAAILKAGTPLPSIEPAPRVLDATGCYVIPGGVDPHVHVATNLGEYQTADDYQQASIAALIGGTTTLVDFAIPDPGASPLDSADQRIAQAASARCRVALHGCVTSTASGGLDDQLAGFIDRGIRSVKLFTTYHDSFMATDHQILSVLSSLRDSGGLTYVHAEWDPLVSRLQSAAQAGSGAGASKLHRMRPVEAELVAVRQVLAAAEALGAPVYFVHLSVPDAVCQLSAARARGVAAFAETCPHYLFLSDAEYETDHAADVVCCPPLRDQALQSSLLQVVADEQVDAIGSDHCCFTREQKRRHADDVQQMPYGLPGVEVRVPLTIHELVVGGLVPWSRAVDLLATMPARLNGIFPKKGTIAVGSDADIVVLDPNRNRHGLTAPDLHMPTDVAPYAAHDPIAWPLWVIAEGVMVVDEGRFQDPGPGAGFLPSGPIENHTPGKW